MQDILQQYGFNEGEYSLQAFGSGLINHTWKLIAGEREFILQRINTHIFKQPEAIAENIRLIADYLSATYPEYLFVAPVKTLDGNEMVHTAEGWFRIFPFVKNSHTIDVVAEPEQAFEAARQFGRFTRMLSEFNAEQLNIPLPDFHHLPLRYRQFETALIKGDMQRIQESEGLIHFLLQQQTIAGEFDKIKPGLKIRVTHHDTKISNVLFDEQDKGLCVIDLDTVMPGYFISDVGDMLRTYLSPVSEEEKDLNKIVVRKEFYEAIVSGYRSEMAGELDAEEEKHFLFAGKYMIYMQALRFLTDHLNGDIYYGSRYPGHNLIRASNQVELLRRLIEFEGK